jgi:hypothetical protein
VSAIAPGALGLATGLPSDKTLLVPIDVAAVSCGFTPTAGTQAVPTETTIPITQPGAPESATLPKPPPLFATPSLRTRGVHLHWAMPDGLTRGDAGEARGGTTAAGNPMGLPALPDRWLVVRMDHGQDAANNAWVIDADFRRQRFITNWGETTPLPVTSLTTPQGQWYYPGKKLTAVAGGDVAWAATYDAVRDRFGFNDQALGVPTTAQVVSSYLVVGWYSNPANTPFAGITVDAPYRQKLRELGWEAPYPFSFPPPAPPDVPTQVILHGLLCGVPLNGVTAEIKPDPTKLEIGLAGSAFNAFAALLGEGIAAQRAASERVLSAFTTGLLARIDEPNGLVAIDEERHAAGFVAISDGTGDQPDRIAEGDPFVSSPDASMASAELPPPEATLQHRGEHEVLEAVFAQADGPLTLPSPQPRTFRDVPTSRPRFFEPADLAIVIRGAGRSLRHGEDSRFKQHGLLPCRLAHDITTSVGGALTEAQLPPALRQIPNTSIPPECVWLQKEACLVDPFRSADRTRWAGRTVVTTEPEPIFVNRFKQAWVPLWCEWELGVKVDDDLSRWTLGPIELAETRQSAPDELVVRGRMLLHASAGKAFAAQVRDWLEEENRRDASGIGQASEASEAALAAAATTADSLDLLTGTFRGLREELLGIDPQRSLVTQIDLAGNVTGKPPVKALPRLLAGGSVRVRRLRIVDAFGRFVDVPDATLSKIEVAATHTHPTGAPRVTLAPRIQRPARLALRFVDPRPADGAEPVEAYIDQEHPETAVSPIAGFLLPDHVDEALECFDAAGRPLGQLMHDPLTEAVVFEGAPGRPGSIGGPPAVDEPGTRHVMRFAEGLIQADATTRHGAGSDESALSALLRAIDTTLWTIDPLGSVGTAAIAGLVGRPIAVVRALLSLDVLSDVDELAVASAQERADRQRAYAELALHAFSVRLGEMTRTDDGLLAYAVDDDYRQLRLVAPEASTLALLSGPQVGQLGLFGAGSQEPPALAEIRHPYVSGPSEVLIRSGQTIRLTLLLSPGGQVHVTSGIVPRKALALARDWFHEALERLSPSFRVGPVLVDPTGVRMPRVTGLGEKQAFTRRTTPLTWRDDPILAASQTALLPDDPAGLQEGWIRVVPEAKDAP